MRLAIASSPFAQGVTAQLHPDSVGAQARAGGAPGSTPVETAVVDASGGVVFTGLEPDTGYWVAGQVVGGAWRWVHVHTGPSQSARFVVDDPEEVPFEVDVPADQTASTFVVRKNGVTLFEINAAGKLSAGVLGAPPWLDARDYGLDEDAADNRAALQTVIDLAGTRYAVTGQPQVVYVPPAEKRYVLLRGVGTDLAFPHGDSRRCALVVPSGVRLVGPGELHMPYSGGDVAGKEAMIGFSDDGVTLTASDWRIEGLRLSSDAIAGDSEQLGGALAIGGGSHWRLKDVEIFGQRGKGLVWEVQVGTVAQDVRIDDLNVHDCCSNAVSIASVTIEDFWITNLRARDCLIAAESLWFHSNVVVRRGHWHGLSIDNYGPILVPSADGLDISGLKMGRNAGTAGVGWVEIQGGSGLTITEFDIDVHGTPAFAFSATQGASHGVKIAHGRIRCGSGQAVLTQPQGGAQCSDWTIDDVTFELEQDLTVVQMRQVDVIAFRDLKIVGAFDGLVDITANTSHATIDGVYIEQGFLSCSASPAEIRGCDITAPANAAVSASGKATLVGNTLRAQGGHCVNLVGDDSIVQGNILEVTDVDVSFWVTVDDASTNVVVGQNTYVGSPATWTEAPGFRHSVGTRRELRRNGDRANVGDGATIAHGLGVTPRLVLLTPEVANRIVSVTARDAVNITVAYKDEAGVAVVGPEVVMWEAGG